MDITDQNRNKLIIAALISLVAGIAIGLIYGYVINPVEWVDAPLELTRADIQEDYLRMAIDAYQQNNDPSIAYQRWQELGDSGPEALRVVMASPGDQGQDAVNRFKDLVIRDSAPVDACQELSAGSNNNPWFYIWLGTVILGGGTGLFYTSHLRRKIASSPTPPYPTPMNPLQAGGPITIPFNQFPVMVHTMMTYVMGDDHFDESLRVEDDLGDFLGECGIGIVNTVDNQLPKKVNALDIWLFDKNEINTKTVVLMSENAYSNEAIFNQMKNKGQPIMAEIGREISLETTNLVMSVRVVDMLCEETDPLNCTFFQRLTMEVFVRRLA